MQITEANNRRKWTIHRDFAIQTHRKIKNNTPDTGVKEYKRKI